MRKLNAVVLAFIINALIFAPVAFPATLGYQIDMLLSQVRTASGGAITNGHVHFYEAGTTTDKTIWTTVNKTTPAANPYNLDSNGTAYVFGDGLYRIVIHSAPDVTPPIGPIVHGPTVYDRDNIRYEDYGSAVARFTSLAGDNTGTLSGFKTITGPGTGSISGFVNLTLTGTITGDGGDAITGFTINGSLLVDNTVTSAKILDNSIASGKILDNTIISSKILDNTITSSKILDNTIALSKIATGRGALAYATGSTQSLDNNTWTIINFSGEDYDTDSIHTVTTDNTKLTVPSGITKVRLIAQVQFDTNSTGIRGSHIYKNGSTYVGYPYQYVLPNSVTETGILLVTPVVTVAGGDYFTVRAYQTSGAGLVVATSNTWFSMEIIK